MSVEGKDAENKEDLEKERLSFQTTAFDALERDFREVLHQMVGDKTLERFRTEYEKLHNTLKKSHENEKKLIKKCKELNKEIVANAAKIQTALRLSLADQSSITTLKKAIDTAWRMVDGAQEKEKRARENVQKLKHEIQNLTRLVDQGAGVSVGQENYVNSLIEKNNQQARELELAQKTIEKNSEAIRSLGEQTESLTKSKTSAEKEKSKLEIDLKKAEADVARYMRQSDRAALEMKQFQQVSERDRQKLSAKTSEHADLQAQFSNTQQQLMSVQNKMAVYENLSTEFKHKMESAEATVKQRERDLAEHREMLLTKENEILREKAALRSANADYTELQKDNAKLQKEKQLATTKKVQAETYRAYLKKEMKAVMQSLEGQRKDAESDEKIIRKLQVQMKRLTHNNKLAEEKNHMQKKLVEHHEEFKRALETDIQAHKKEEQDLRKQNYILEKQFESATLQIVNLKQKYDDAEETIKLQKMDMIECQKQLKDEKDKLKGQRTLYEQVRSDRNMFSKQQVQSEDEIAEMKRKFKIMAHQIDQLKEEIQAKDNALINEHFSYLKQHDQMKVVSKKLAKRHDTLATANKVIQSQDAEIKNLRRTLADVEKDQIQNKRVYDDVLQERDILGTQLIRRNDELALLYEKIRIQQSTLSKGEVQYRQRLKDIRQLQLELINLKRLLQIQSHEVTNIEALKNEVYHVQRELLQERTKVKALSEELENPMNVHRWRKLDGSDPEQYELIQKIQTLQKRLIQKTEQVVEKDLLIKDKDKLLAELKNLLARQPGPEVAEQLSVYQHSLKEKTRQMKAMTAELNMFQAQASEYKVVMDRTGRELNDVKRRYFEHKRKDQIVRAMERAEDPNRDPLVKQQGSFHDAQQRITGGGFNLSAPANRLMRATNN
jgi:chromosome segregation ATPase